MKRFLFECCQQKFQFETKYVHTAKKNVTVASTENKKPPAHISKYWRDEGKKSSMAALKKNIAAEFSTTQLVRLFLFMHFLALRSTEKCSRKIIL